MILTLKQKATNKLLIENSEMRKLTVGRGEIKRNKKETI